MDFAGGTVVHINAGVAGLVVAAILGPRKNYGKITLRPFSPILVVLGASLLWFGWFGFNAGIELAADGIAANAFLVTNISASLGVIGWLLMEYVVYRKATLVGGASGAIAGLVAITPASGSAGIVGAIIIGFVGGLLGAISVARIKRWFRVDDSLDAFWVHGLVGIWGSIATALFLAPYLTAPDYDMLAQLLKQLKTIAVTIL
jgi:Amt family ammonium transporter